MIRHTVHFTGRVQGVGFRYTTRDIAANHRIAGYVQNLPDGRVRLVVEGKDADVERFVNEVTATMKRCVQHTAIDKSDATGEFADEFSIRY